MFSKLVNLFPICADKILSKIGEGALSKSYLLSVDLVLYPVYFCQYHNDAAGTFGRVLECWDRETREFVAIKVVRSIRKYRHAAMIEIEVLNNLAKNDKDGSRYVQI